MPSLGRFWVRGEALRGVISESGGGGGEASDSKPDAFDLGADFVGMWSCFAISPGAPPCGGDLRGSWWSACVDLLDSVETAFDRVASGCGSTGVGSW